MTLPHVKQRGVLSVVGTGIGGVSQTTLEAIACMETADCLYYSMPDKITEHWVRSLNSNAVSFASLYRSDRDRRLTYRKMIDTVAAAVHSGQVVCFALYGHPGVYADPSHDAIAQLRAEGFTARMYPAVSADAVMFADLGINPGRNGMQSFEATDFLLRERTIDPTSGLLLWQVGVLGEGTGRYAPCRPERLERLVHYLERYYESTHEVILYQAATFPGLPPIVVRVPLERLPRLEVTPMMLLFVPPRPQRSPQPEILRWFDEPRICD